MKKENILLAVVIVIFLASTCCRVLRTATKTVNNIARNYCEEHVYSVRKKMPSEQKYKLTPKQWCDIQQNIQPFIDILTLNEAKMKREMEESK